MELKSRSFTSKELQVADPWPRAIEYWMFHPSSATNPHPIVHRKFLRYLLSPSVQFHQCCTQQLESTVVQQGGSTAETGLKDETELENSRPTVLVCFRKI
ncbi:hypothetical protein TNCV_2074531 [Trichonephila clavipes]|nr:hypothetical protein TNCV_2074531 [Trichonephila clavipes]